MAERPYDWQAAGDFAPAAEARITRDELRWNLRMQGKELCISCCEREAEPGRNLCRICRAA